MRGFSLQWNEVPYEVRTRWQRVWVNVHEQVYSTATNAVQVTRALEWFMVVAQLLLRDPKRLRGGR